MELELCHGEGFRSMKSDALQGQSSLRNVCSATEYVSQVLTLFSRISFSILDCDYESRREIESVFRSLIVTHNRDLLSIFSFSIWITIMNHDGKIGAGRTRWSN